MQQETATSLSEWVTPEAYQASRIEHFPSFASWQWQCRLHRERLVQAGAIARISGRMRVHPQRFDAVIVQIGLDRVGAGAARPR